MSRIILEKALGLARRAGLANVPRGPAVAVMLLVLVAGGAASGRALTRSDESLVILDSEESLVVTESPVAGSEASLEASAPSVAFVHVVGAVARPGVYRLESGARVAEAVEAAGGLLGSAAQEGVNLARPVQDGEQVRVPTVDEYLAAGTPDPGTESKTGTGSETGLVDINSADENELQELPGIGPSTAGKIVADREQNGPFERPEDLTRVSGIGPKKYEALADLITVR